MSKPTNKESIKFAKYISVGLFNTGFGYLIIFSAMYLGINPYASNFIGYGLGILLSFYLQKSWVFASPGNLLSKFSRFLLVFGVAYLANLTVLFTSIDKLNLNEYLSQITAGLFYLAIGYSANNFFVFKNSY